MSSPLSLPSPCHDVDTALAHLLSAGVCVMTGVLSASQLERARTAIYRAAQEDAMLGRQQHGFPLDTDDTNVRVWNLLNRDAVFCELAEHPLALQLVRALLGWPALLSNISGNITGPGPGTGPGTGSSGAKGALHADQIFVPEPWPPAPQGVNVGWCLDDFTATNGATEVAVGSHHWHRPPGRADDSVEMAPLLAPAGSLFAFESRLWHRAGANTSRADRRAAVFAFYSRPIYRTQENWFLSLTPDVLENASETLLSLLAYKSAGFGLVYGRSPR